MGLFSHRVKESDLKACDHIYVYRPPLGLYSHHGIYLGDGMVVHFSSPNNSHVSGSSSKDGNGVSTISLKDFLKNGKLRRYEYGVSAFALAAKVRGGATTVRSDPPRDVIRRGEYLLENGFGNYDLVRNNCEVFALYCKTGRLIRGTGSGQIASATSVPFSLFSFPFFAPLFFAESLGSYLLGLTPALVVGAPLIVGFVVAAVSAALLFRIYFRYASDFGLRSAVKVEVEDLAAFRSAVKVEVEDLAAIFRLQTTLNSRTNTSITPAITNHLNSPGRFGRHHYHPTDPLGFNSLRFNSVAHHR